MSYKTLFVFGLLVAAAWTAALPEDKVLSEEAVLPSATASAKVDFGDLKLDDDNVEKVEKVVKTENSVSAIGKNKFFKGNKSKLIHIFYSLGQS